MRLLRIIKSIDPIGYAGSVITYPLPLALISALLVGGKAVPLLALGTAVSWRGQRYHVLKDSKFVQDRS
jgi:ceramide glucosyltransferase